MSDADYFKKRQDAFERLMSNGPDVARSEIKDLVIEARKFLEIMVCHRRGSDPNPSDTAVMQLVLLLWEERVKRRNVIVIEHEPT